MCIKSRTKTLQSRICKTTKVSWISSTKTCSKSCRKNRVNAIIWTSNYRICSVSVNSNQSNPSNLSRRNNRSKKPCINSWKTFQVRRPFSKSSCNRANSKKNKFWPPSKISSKRWRRWSWSWTHRAKNEQTRFCVPATRSSPPWKRRWILLLLITSSFNATWVNVQDKLLSFRHVY